MIKDGRNGSMPLGTSFLRKMRELPVIIRENISMHNICFQVNIEKPPLCCVTYIVIKWMREEKRVWVFLEFLRNKHLLNRSTHSNELRGAKGDTEIEKILKFIFVECLRQFLVLHHRINNM